MIDKFSIFNGGKYFSLGIFQNYLVFMPAIKYIKYFRDTTQIYSWKSNGMSVESIGNIIQSDQLLLIIIHHQTYNLMDTV